MNFIEYYATSGTRAETRRPMSNPTFRYIKQTAAVHVTRVSWLNLREKVGDGV